MKETLERHFQEELEIGVKKIQENMRPYSHFVKSQHKEVQAFSVQLQQLQQQMDKLGLQIDNAFNVKGVTSQPPKSK